MVVLRSRQTTWTCVCASTLNLVITWDSNRVVGIQERRRVIEVKRTHVVQVVRVGYVKVDTLSCECSNVDVLCTNTREATVRCFVE